MKGMPDEMEPKGIRPAKKRVECLNRLDCVTCMGFCEPSECQWYKPNPGHSYAERLQWAWHGNLRYVDYRCGSCGEETPLGYCAHCRSRIPDKLVVCENLGTKWCKNRCKWGRPNHSEPHRHTPECDLSDDCPGKCIPVEETNDWFVLYRSGNSICRLGEGLRPESKAMAQVREQSKVCTTEEYRAFRWSQGG